MLFLSSIGLVIGVHWLAPHYRRQVNVAAGFCRNSSASAVLGGPGRALRAPSTGRLWAHLPGVGTGRSEADAHWPFRVPDRGSGNPTPLGGWDRGGSRYG